ncbi:MULTISPECIES: DUF1010 domain-containing protein [Comamonas]|uniref:DUF1010 domain-containing protein n=1 Tax=Comamonas TaxID=283 RepID=UPI000E0AEEB0|nr:MULTISPECIES: DUF1010 domain-containing protein [Comamonas]QQN68197.1 DUF1010 domain-containing protein [Comamonas testosteroni]
MNIQTPFTFSSVYSLGFWGLLVLRLRRFCQFQAFLGSSRFTVSTSSYGFRSFAEPRWRGAFPWVTPIAKSGGSLLAFWSNPSVLSIRRWQSTCLSRYNSHGASSNSS